MLFSLPISTIVVSEVWTLDAVSGGGLFALAVFVGCRYVLYTDVESDKTSWFLYNVSNIQYPHLHPT